MTGRSRPRPSTSTADARAVRPTSRGRARGAGSLRAPARAAVRRAARRSRRPPSVRIGEREVRPDRRWHGPRTAAPIPTRRAERHRLAVPVREAPAGHLVLMLARDAAADAARRQHRHPGAASRRSPIAELPSTSCSRLSSTSNTSRSARCRRRLLARSRPGASRTLSTPAIAGITSVGSVSGLRSTKNTPSGNRSSCLEAVSSASRVFPCHPGR